MQTKVKVLDSFMHGRDFYVRDDELVVPKSEAQEMEKSGLVKIVGDESGAEASTVAAQKMEPVTSNKMEKAPANKAAAKPKNK